MTSAPRRPVISPLPTASRRFPIEDFAPKLGIFPHATVSLVAFSDHAVIGGYQCRLEYDPTLLRVFTVQGAGEWESAFAAAPHTLPDQFAGGKTPLVARQPSRTGPKGRVVLARITFEPLQVGKARLAIAKATVIDPDGSPLPSARLAVFPATLEILPDEPSAWRKMDVTAEAPR